METVAGTFNHYRGKWCLGNPKRLSPASKYWTMRFIARKKNRECDITIGQYIDMMYDATCHYCLDDCATDSGYGLDRKDNARGYALDNVVPCCHSCNRKKKARPYDEFMAEVLERRDAIRAARLPLIRERANALNL